MKTTVMGQAMVKAMAAPNKEGNGNILAKISEIAANATPKFTDEELAARGKEAEDRKSAAQLAAVKLLELENELKRIEGVYGWEGVPELIRAHQQYSATRQKIVAVGDEVFKLSLEVSRMIAEITSAVPSSRDEVVAWMKKVAAAGRGRLLSQSETDRRRNNGEAFPRQTIFFGEFCLVPQPSEFYSEGISPADKKIFYELGRLVMAYQKGEKKLRRDRMKEMKDEGIPNLRRFIAGEEETYRIHFSGNKKYKEGIGLVEVINLNQGTVRQPFLVVRVVDGAGSLGWMSAYKGEWIPFAAVRTGQVLRDKTPAEKLEFSEKLVRVLNYVYRDTLRELKNSQK